MSNKNSFQTLKRDIHMLWLVCHIQKIILGKKHNLVTSFSASQKFTQTSKKLIHFLKIILVLAGIKVIVEIT